MAKIQDLQDKTIIILHEKIIESIDLAKEIKTTRNRVNKEKIC